MSRIFLETERMVLRELTEADAGEVFRLNNDPAVMRYINGGRPMSIEDVRDGIMPKYLQVYERFGGQGNWAAIGRETGCFLGLFNFRPDAVDAVDDFELGYRLRRSAWGRGLATEGAVALIRTGFTELGLSRAWAQTMAVNTGSRRVMERAGLRHVRTFHAEWPEGEIEGSEHGDVEYAITESQWRSQD